MEKTHPVYEEIPIKDPEREIRILTIRPSFGSALASVQTILAQTISCTLEKFDIEHAEPFEALSYCWGDDKTMKRISLNERSFLIRENLWLALKHLQQKKIPRRIWIDAICINQESHHEINAQVSIMKKIYSTATMVIAWIGPEVKNVKSVFEYCNILGSGNTDGLLDSDKPQRINIKHDAPQAEKEKRAQKTSGSAHLEDIYKLDWFGRVWILQEVAVGKKVLMKCGDHNIWLLDFLQASRKILQQNYNMVIIKGNDPEKVLSHRYNRYTAFSNITQCHQPSHQTAELSIPSLASMMIACRHFDATLAADKVFALYGLAYEDVQQLRLYPQYNIPPEKVYTDVTYALLHELSDSSCLEVPRGNAQLRDKLPSWVPDWNDRSYIGPGLTSDHFSERKPMLDSTESKRTGAGLPREQRAGHSFCASGDSHFICTREDGNVLSLQGLLIDEISDVLGDSSLEWDPFQGPWMDTLVSMYVGLECQQSGEKQYPTGEHYIEAYVRCLCAGSLSASIPALPTPGQPTVEREQTEENLMRVVKKFVGIWRSGAKWRDLFQKLPSGPYEVIERLRGYRVDSRQEHLLEKGIGTFVIALYAQLRNEWDTYSQVTMAFSTTFRRRFALTKKGYFALVPPAATKGDHIFIPLGGKLPLVTRSKGEMSELIGESYVHGGMYGEAWDERSCEIVRLC